MHIKNIINTLKTNNIPKEVNIFNTMRLLPIIKQHTANNNSQKTIHTPIPITTLSIELFDNKKIKIYSHYSKNGQVDIYNYYMINLFSNIVDTVFVLSNLPQNIWNIRKYNIKILNYDFKNDFANLYIFINRHQISLNKIKCLFIINDSFLVVDKTVFEKKIQDDFFSTKHVENFQGLILSTCFNIHYQSYFLCIQGTIISNFIYFFKQTGYPKDYEDSIHKYELGLSRAFLNKTIKYDCYNTNPTVSHPYELIKKYGIIKRQQLLSTYKITGQISCNQIQELKNKHIHNRELVEYINTNSCI